MLSSIHAPNMKNHKKGTHLAKVAATHVMERKGGEDTNDWWKTHHGEDTNGAGSIQALATPATLHVNTHNVNAHRHNTIAVISKPPYGDADEIPTYSPFKKRNGGPPSRTRKGRRPLLLPPEEYFATASEQS